jgi:hypothetical protein
VHATLSDRLSGEGPRRSTIPASARVPRPAPLAEAVGEPIPTVEVGQ